MARSDFTPGTVRWATRRAQWRALGLVTDGDTIHIDLAGGAGAAPTRPARVCDLLAEPGEFEARRPEPLPDHAETGWLSVYRRTVRPLGQGAVLRLGRQETGIGNHYQEARDG